jgi:phosphoglycerate kinase
MVRTLDGLDIAGKRVLLRADLNVPVHDGRITDLTRLERLTPTIRELLDKKARLVICSHFGRPKGKRVPELSLRPVAEALGQVIGRPVGFVEECIGESAERAVAALAPGEAVVLENTRFHPGEEANDPAMAQALARLADIYVNDAFSAAHRAHASTVGVASYLPAYAGRLMQRELEALSAALEHPARPLAAVVGGAKVSTKLDLLRHLLSRVDALVIGGAMANTFLAAQGVNVGQSLQEPEMHATARDILAAARDKGTEILLPVDVVLTTRLVPGAEAETAPLSAIPEGRIIVDVGPETVSRLAARLGQWKTLVWNGPLGAFEVPPFDRGTVAFAQKVAEATQKNQLLSVAGGGDTVSALRQAGVIDALSYVSTAGGAFLEWLEGKTLPGVAVLG